MRSTANRPTGIRILILAAAVLAASASICQALEFPGPAPGAARAVVADGQCMLENDAIACVWTLRDGQFRPTRVTDKLAGAAIEFDPAFSQCFVLGLASGKRLAASEMKLVGAPRVERIEAEPGASCLARRSPGMKIVADFVSPEGNLEVRWEAVLRDGSSYVRPSATLEAKREPVDVASLELIDLAVKGDATGRVVGSVPGSPVVSGDFFFAYEHANAASTVKPAGQGRGAQIVCGLTRNAAVRPGEPTTQTSVIGVVPQGQLRRGFLYYVERQRAHPYRPALHYNSWYDVSWPGHRMTEAECLAVIETFGRELTEKRGVRLQCFLWDDGWDDPTTLWQVDKQNFPRGFAPLVEAAKKYHSRLCVWMSPWGGYGDTKTKRVEQGRTQGFETVGPNFSMAGPNYYRRFLETSLGWIRDSGSVHFKYDGMNAAQIEEADAMFRLIAELRKVQPELFVNMTTGTWPSVYYLWLGDSTWRGGDDMGFTGPGSKRQQWVNYRDADTYRGVVCRGPLYPINSLMTQGVVEARFGYATQLAMEPDEFRDEVRSFFASGTCTQELYITPQKLSGRNWDDLAEAARWSQGNADVLVDTHWLGGDPGKGEAYGWASWSPRQGILALRNPSDKPGRITLDVARAFELPPGSPQSYALKSPWKEDAAAEAIVLDAGREHTFELKPFEVRVWDAVPRQ
jgi:hypothetical protein